MKSPEFQLVSATRLEEAAFWSDTLLGRSLRQPQHRQLVARICFSNDQPLAVSYNTAIDAAPAGAVLVFCHDDLDLGPESLGPELEAALARFDLVGVAGNQRQQSGQAGWWLNPRSGGWDHPFLSGALRHGTPDSSRLDVYGPAPMPVQLLDGVFLAVRADTLQRSGVRFDPRFDFHYYDLDVCRSARRAGLSLGTWPLPLLHASGGEPWGAAWNELQRAYWRKWGRMGASLCAATGLEELICPTPEAYQERAIALGNQPTELERLRRQLLERRSELPLFNTAAWVGHLESLLERLLVAVAEH
jgi:hypothetical protein